MQGPGLSPIKSPINSNKYLSKQKNVSSLSDLRKLSPKSQRQRVEVLQRSLVLMKQLAIGSINKGQPQKVISALTNLIIYGAKIEYLKMVGIYLIIANKCVLTNSVYNIQQYITQASSTHINDDIGEARKVWMNNLKFTIQYRNLTIKSIIILSKCLIKHHHQQTYQFYTYYLKNAQVMESSQLFGHLLYSFYSYIHNNGEVHSLKETKIMKLLNDFLELEDKKNESTTEMLSYLVNKTFQTYSVIKKKFKFYYQQHQQELTQAMNNSLKRQHNQQGILLSLMETNQQELTTTCDQWKLTNVTQQKAIFLCSVSLFLKQLSLKKSSNEDLEKLQKKFIQLFEQHEYVDGNPLLIYVVNQIKRFEDLMLEYIKNISMSMMEEDSNPLIKCRSLLQIRKRILFNAQINSQSKKSAYATTLYLLIMSHWTHPSEGRQRIFKIQKFIKETDKIAEASYRIWFNILNHAVQQNGVVGNRIMQYALECDKILQYYTTQVTDSKLLPIFKLVNEYREKMSEYAQYRQVKSQYMQYFGQVSYTIGKTLLRELLKDKYYHMHKTQNYYKVLAYSMFMLGMCRTEEHKRSELLELIKIVEDKVDKVQYIRHIYTNLVFTYIHSLKEEQIHSLISTFKQLCKQQPLVLVDFIQCIKYYAIKEQINILNPCDQVQEQSFGNLKAYLLSRLKGAPKSMCYLLQLSNQTIYSINNNNQYKSYQIPQLNIQQELKECCQYTKQIMKVLNYCQQHISTFTTLQEQQKYQFRVYTVQFPQTHFKRVISNCSNLILICNNVGYHSLKEQLIFIKLSIIQQVLKQQCVMLQISKLKFMQLYSFSQSLINEIRVKYLIKMNKKNDNQMDLYRKVRLFLGGEYNHQQMIEKLIYALNHINYRSSNHFKELMKAINSYIWEKCFTEKEILSFKKDLLPNQNCKTSTYSQRSWFIHEEMMQLIPYQLCTICLSYIYQFIILNRQTSLLRSLFKLGIIYFMRSRNIEGCILAFTAYLQKMGHKFNINIKIIIDSFHLILTQSNPSHNIKDISSLFVQKRRSVSNIYNIQTIGKKLIFLGQCHQVGNKLLWFYLRFLSIQFNIPIHSSYSKYLQLKQSPDSSQQRKMKSIFQQLEQLQVCEQLLIRMLRQLIIVSYFHASILQSYIGSLPDKSDSLVFQMSLLMLDYNYNLKSMIQKLSILKLKSCSNLELIFFENQKISSFKENYIREHIEKKQKIKGMKQPLSILYPLGDKVYNIAVTNPLLVTHMDRFSFQDNQNTLLNLIQNHNKLLQNKTINARQWWQGRQRIDRQIKQLTDHIELGIFDTHANQYLIYLTKYGFDQRLAKLIGQEPNQLKYAQHLCNNKIQFMKIMSEWKQSVNKSGQPLILLTDHSYFYFPYEISNALKARSVFRVPSIAYVHQKLSQSQNLQLQFDVKKTTYLVNTSNDLAQTQNCFVSIRNKFPQWNKGIIGRTPTLKQFSKLLCSDNLIYMGHGTGTNHFKEYDFYNKEIKNMMMIFGCSSIAMCRQSSQPHGIVYSHLINKCPTILGCLWQVTDGDVDKVTKKIFQKIKATREYLPAIIKRSKKVCQLQNLTGGALVIYGIPSTLFDQ